MSQNAETLMTVDEAVAEVLGLLTGLDLEYDPNQDRYQAIVRCLNRALRSNALEHEWSYYASLESCGETSAGDTEVQLRSSVRVRGIGDDSVRLVNLTTGRPYRWAYLLPRDALHKYRNRNGLWASVTAGNLLQFSRPLWTSEAGLDIQVPVMREPLMIRLPAQPENPVDPIVPVPDSTRNQELDFVYPDVVILRAAFYYAQADPVMQPRVQTLEAQYKDLMYQIIERDDRITDAPYMNDFFVPVQSGLRSGTIFHGHPHADERR